LNHLWACGENVTQHPAHQALRLQIETSLGRRPDRDWVRSSGRSRNRWIDQLRQDHQRPPADLWRAAIQRGDTEATLRSSTTTTTGQNAISRQPCEIFIPKFLGLRGRDPATILYFYKNNFCFLQSYSYINIILCYIFNSARNNQQQRPK